MGVHVGEKRLDMDEGEGVRHVLRTSWRHCWLVSVEWAAKLSKLQLWGFFLTSATDSMQQGGWAE